MFRNTLFTKLLFLLIIGSTLLISGTYYLAIPLIDQRIYEIEERAGKSALDNFYVLLQQTKQDLAAFETYSLNSHKEKLKDIVNIASTCLDRIQTTHNQGNLTLEEARAEAITQIRSFKYSHNDYLYISDYNGNLIYHPDPNLNETNISELKDINGKLIILPMITKAKVCADVFYDYWWNRLGEKKPSHKLTYAKDLPRWEWVLFSGVHLDDIHNEVDVRKEKLIHLLRDHVRTSKIATEGYLYVFDGNLNMVIHPNSNIEGTNFSALKNPASGESVGKELIEVAHSGNKSLKYKWDKPSDPGHYIYDKVSWVRYLPEYDYYIASSVYLEDLQSSGKYLAIIICYHSVVDRLWTGTYL